MRLVVVIVTLTATLTSSGCLTYTRWTEVRLKDTDDVKIEDAPKGAQVKRTKKDIKVDKKSILADGRMRGWQPPAVVRRVDSAPDALHLKDGRYRWRDGDVTASTPKDNLGRTFTTTFWHQDFGLLGSMAFIVGGAFFGLGFGAAGAGLLSDGLAEDDDTKVAQGAAFLTGAAACTAVFTYGVVTFVLLQGSPWIDPIDVIDE